MGKKAVNVGSLFAMIEDDKLVGVEIGFNSNVRDREGVAEIISNLTASCHSTKWIMNNVMRWKDAQAEGNRNEDSSDDYVDAEQEGEVGKIRLADIGEQIGKPSGQISPHCKWLKHCQIVKHDWKNGWTAGDKAKDYLKHWGVI